MAHEEEFNPSRSRVRVLARTAGEKAVPVTCLQCDDAGCMAVCPAHAITDDVVTGARLINETRCIKCTMCMQICAFGATFQDERSRKMLKCDLCDGDPLCAKACPSGAIVSGEAATANAAKRLVAARKMKVFSKGGRG
ncbi:4Fe-4S ferredoxin, iron-sulfur binding protein [Rhodospirillum rubrum F11]|uniref:4Fe-4S ferredoxin, iron-sulfur binding n=2 Tax=Rhodospirillum rubrum TaxID=1085 RepID=Q2RXM8_RHORT|nr:4Fe-4S dicluster domain-containing protein [Rhodospirillum rubrum]ABC21117.1 4Fe-4S ferredoxin, iron-sulfur binding [Rhodospirillum rubrum ATCC 11170]AEO46785.1 4Fe-4S ferredoxin, iron-sulfur binding protein [Rhodospirillum rubrum F11]MBK5952664.1 4Fe-4S ferredoxin [Rhodospirillum rubrum]QXG80809.1 4Fe-4S dicluster domain-containing protein [Rhodospirillum rubrum]HAQ00279.1 4Fe-4S dicluster domain-containing protein [Rhodospirillum rubrum]